MGELRKGSQIGRYIIHDEIASGGMAVVHFGRLLGPVGFARTVAIKRLHAQYSKDPSFVTMFLDEARLAARIRHPNVAATLDVVAQAGELFLVMEYVQGETLARLASRVVRQTGERMPIKIAASILSGALHGLHAAHEARNERGEALDIVHRDFSPQNVLVGVDGVARVLDFGVAKAAGRIHTTRDGSVKGKMRYMAPEQLQGAVVDRRADIFAAGVVLWELLTGQSLFKGETDAAVVTNVLTKKVPPPSSIAVGLPAALDAVTKRALRRDPSRRFATARDMAVALEAASEGIASALQVGAWLESIAGEALAKRAAVLAALEGEHTGELLDPARIVRELASSPDLGPPAADDSSSSAPLKLAAPDVADDAATIARGSGSDLKSLASAELPSVSSSPRRLRNALGLAGVGASILAVGVWLGARASTSAPTVARAHAADAVPAAPPAAPPPAVVSAPTPSASEPPTPPASAAPTPVAPPAPSAARPAKRPPKDECDPPYTIDKANHVIYKRSCLTR